ncbi:hypothetical protein Leryth_017252 [Lithospermum erythrorhizon]|nr:hypothetical protein Leryth_017252 [Lithospermum erythrorhizon]
MASQIQCNNNSTLSESPLFFRHDPLQKQPTFLNFSYKSHGNLRLFVCSSSSENNNNNISPNNNNSNANSGMKKKGSGGSSSTAVSNSNYVVPMDNSSCITRPLGEILRDLNKRIPDNIIKIRIMV